MQRDIFSTSIATSYLKIKKVAMLVVTYLQWTVVALTGWIYQRVLFLSRNLQIWPQERVPYMVKTAFQDFKHTVLSNYKGFRIVSCNLIGRNEDRYVKTLKAALPREAWRTLGTATFTSQRSRRVLREHFADRRSGPKGQF